MRSPYYESGGITLYHGDCFEVLPNLKAAAVICDPPYAIPTQIAQTRTVAYNLGDLSLVEQSFRRLFDLTLGVVGKAGRHFVFADGASYPVIFRAIYGRASTALLVWDKGRIGMGREFRKQHELIMHSWGSDTPIYSDGVGRADILRCPPVPSAEREHPAQKPTALLTELIRVCGDGVILDPFVGSGSTLLAARESGRPAIGIEIDERYCEIAAKRLSGHQVDKEALRLG